MNRVLLLAYLILVTATAGHAGLPIDGMVLITAVDLSAGSYAYFLEGDTSSASPAPDPFQYGRMCPTLDRVAYVLRTFDFPQVSGHVWTANIDAANPHIVTADIGGINCNPAWSPDGSQIAFQHADPTAELSPCQVGFETWVVGADGSNPHRVSPLGMSVYQPTWALDGYRVVCHTDAGAYLVDSDGTDWAVLPDIGGQAAWSPDSTCIAATTYVPDTVGGQTGVWRNLVLTDTNGKNPMILWMHFVTDADISAYLAVPGRPMPEGVDPVVAVRCHVGVNDPQWSPRGNQIMFRDTASFDPLGIDCPFQTELWLYDFGSHTFTRLTENEIAETTISWGGYNTQPDQLTVTVGAVTITFEQVLSPGVTVVLRDDDPPNVPAGLEFDGCYYEIHTTATTTGPVMICMEYSDAAVPEGTPEELLAIVHWDGEQWVDATVARDPDTNTICAQVDSLSPIGLRGAREGRFSDVPAWGLGDDGLSPHWAYYAIQSCADGGVVAGYDDGTYQPGGSVTRDQMAVYIARALAGNDGSVPQFAGAPTFPDVPDTFWALKYVEYAVDQGVVTGYGDGTYHPNLPVDRGQMAVYVARAKGWVAIGDDMTQAPEIFPDVPAGYWAGLAVQECVEHEVVAGYDDGLYRPAQTVTRDQMAMYVARAFLW